jgi:hypothetical protein
MSLAPGTRLGAYDVLALIGAGGMGEKLCSGWRAMNKAIGGPGTSCACPV